MCEIEGNKDNKNREENRKLLEYVNFVRQRVSFAKLGIIEIEENEFRFYYKIYEKIKDYAKTHILFFKFLIGKYDNIVLQKLLGCNERSVFRFLKRQREDFIDFILGQETVYYTKFPFISQKARLQLDYEEM